jgi:enoyl-CoA hydratase/carnithine racemase
MAFVNVSVNEGIADIVLNRPKVNALNRALIEELGAAFQRVTRDEAIRGALLRSEGKCFSAGLDLKEVAGYDRDGVISFLGLFDSGIRPVFECPKPVAAAVSGHAIAGGLVLALCADFLALGEGEYKLGLTELLVGVPFPREAFEAVRVALGPRATRRLIYSAELMGPHEAYELGVGDALVEDPEMTARFWLTMVTARPLQTFAIAKRQIRGEAMARIEAVGGAERAEVIETLFSPEVRQALGQALR